MYLTKFAIVKRRTPKSGTGYFSRYKGLSPSYIQ